ncbi:HDOD domain-containing protein [Neptuniibacter halophilus]|uniref:HDOD domain-containing protein n=1 Tax=Neptuniibacter halophilus TaxID=651666 RepID=UPI0025723C4A|nr:HDOD domain-containing protein [Neptuniibacter halophilus]
MKDQSGSIIFIDDESAVLSSLRRALRSRLRDWELVFEQSPERALEQVQSIRPWVVVAEKRMLPMDGAELLSRVKHLQPDAVRVILSADTSEGTALTPLESAHILLPKPFDIDLLTATIERAACLRHFALSDQVRREIGSLQTLPVLPATYRRLVEYVESTDDVDSDRVAALISQDVAVLSKLVQLANSPFWGYRTQVYSARDAVVRLGLDLVRKVVLSVGLFVTDVAEGEHAGLLTRAERVAEKSLLLARESGRSRAQVEQAYFTGLLHNIGELVELGGKTGLSADTLGAFLLQLWGFEQSLVDSLRYQSDPLAQPQPAVQTCQLYIARRLLEAESGNVAPEALLASLDPDLLECAALPSDYRS